MIFEIARMKDVALIAAMNDDDLDPHGRLEEVYVVRADRDPWDKMAPGDIERIAQADIAFD